MKSKLFSLFGLSVLVLIMFMGVGSATDCLRLEEVFISDSVNQDVGSIEITFNLLNTESICDTLKDGISWSATSNKEGTWTLPTLDSIDYGDTEELTATFDLDEHQSGTLIMSISLTGNDEEAETLSLTDVTINEDESLSVSPSTIPEWENSTTITIKNEGNTPLTDIQLTQSGDFTVEFNNTGFSLDAGDSEEITVTMTTDLDDLEIGENQVTITATASDDTTDSGTVIINKSFCDCQDPGELDVKIDDINVKEGFGDDDDYWYLFDEIEIEIDVEVDGSWDIENIEIEWQLHTTDGKEIMDGDESDFNLDYNEDKTITITFKLDEDIDDFEGENAIFYIKATGKIDDNDAGDSDGESTCDWASKEIEIITNDDFVILDEIEFSEVVQCGSEISVTADVWNIGDDEQDDVYVLIYNTELGSSEKVEIGDIDAFEDEKLDVLLKIPQDAEEKWYSLTLSVYDDSNDIYENSEDDEAEFTILFKVEGSCEVEQTAVVSASLESGGEAGQELVVKAVITNTGDELATYTLNAAGYDEWASSPVIEPGTIILGAGESKEVLITFVVNKDASGEKFFDIEVLSENELIVKQPVSVSIEKEESGFAGITGRVFADKGNLYLWGIGALNIILVIIIILVAVRVARK